MGRADYFELGDYNAACSMCGRKRKASQLVRNWQGMYRCPEHNEQRQPQDFVRAIPDIMSVPWAQPETDTFVAFCTLSEISAVPGYAYPGCMIPGRAQYQLADGGYGYGTPPPSPYTAPSAPVNVFAVASDEETPSPPTGVSAQ